MQTTVSFEGLGLTFDINSVAFKIGNFNVYWYGILIASGFLLAMVFAMFRSKDFGIDNEKMTDAVIAGIIGAIIGARAYYVIFKWQEFESFGEMLDIRSGGLAIYGGIIGALLFGGVTCKIKKIKLFPMFDLTAMGLFIGQAIGRWGNFFNQEAFGTNTDLPWGMFSGETERYLSAEAQDLLQKGIAVTPGAPVHPCFLYESILCALGFVVLLAIKKRRKFDGEVFCSYLVIYGTGRFFIEGLRTDSLMIGGVRVSQLLSATVAVAALLIIIYKRVFGKCALYVNSEEYRSLPEKNKKPQQVLSEGLFEEDGDKPEEDDSDGEDY